MNKQFAYISRYYKDSVHKHIKEDGFDNLLNEFGILPAKKMELIKYITDSLENTITKSKRNYFYIPKDCRDYHKRKTACRVPIFGVKEDAPIKRSLPNICFFIAEEKEMAKETFFRHVFGTDYITTNEMTDLEEPLLALDKPEKLFSWEIKAENRERVLEMAEIIWSCQEKDSHSRFIFVIDQAEEKSLDLLRQLYMLFPARIRMEYGFETNINTEDLELLFGRDGEKMTPVYFMTMDKEIAPKELPEAYSRIHLIDLTEMPPSEEKTPKRDALERFSSFMDKRTDYKFRFAEASVMEEKDTVTSFEIYGDILERMNDNSMFWWMNTIPKTIEDFKESYEKTESMMECTEIREEFTRIFVEEMLPKSNYVQQLVERLLNGADASNDEYIKFFNEKLNFTPFTKASEYIITELLNQKAEAVSSAEKHETDIVEKLKKEHEDDKRSLEEKHQKEIEAKEKAKDEAIEKLNEKHSEDLKKEKESYDALEEKLNKELEEKDKELSMHKSEIEEKEDIITAQVRTIENLNENIAENNSKIKKIQNELESLEKSVSKDNFDKLEEKIRDLKAEIEGKEKDLIDSEEKLGKAKSARAVVTGLAATFLLTTAGGGAGTYYMMTQKNQLKEDYSALEKQIENDKDAVKEVEDQLAVKQSENEVLQASLTKLNNENDGLRSSIEELNAKIQELNEQIGGSDDGRDSGENPGDTGKDAIGSDTTGSDVTGDNTSDNGKSVQLLESGTVVIDDKKLSPR